MKRRRVVIAGVTASAGFFALNSVSSLSGADAQSIVQTMHSAQQASRANLNRQLQQTSSNPMQGFALANIAISTPNQEKMIAWYRDVLGFRLVEKTEGAGGINLAIVEKDGVQIDLIQPPTISPVPKPQEPPLHLETPGIRNLVFWVDDLKAAESSLKSKNVPLLFESVYVEGIKTTISAFRDPDGNLVALWQKRKSQQ